MIGITLQIVFWWIVAGLITNLVTEHLWKKKRISRADIWRLVMDVIKGPIGLGIYLYYVIKYFHEDFKKYYKDKDYD